MKVIFFIPNIQYGGTEKVVSLLANELSKKRDISILTLQDYFPISLSNKKIDLSNLLDRDISKYRMKYLRLSYLLSKYLDNMGDKYIIIAMGEVPIAVTGLMKILFKSDIRFIAGIRNFESKHFQTEGSGLLRFFKKRLFSFLLNKADSIVANSKEIREDLIKNFFIKNRIRVIYNPVEIAKKKNAKKTEGPCKVLNVGRMEPQKGQGDILKISTYFKKQSLRCEFNIVGNGSLFQDYKTMIKENKLNNVKLHRHADDIKHFYEDADIFLLTSYWEGLPNVLLEALSFGLPVISYDCSSGPREILCNGKYGDLCEVGDLDQLKEFLEKKVNSTDTKKNFMLSMKRAGDLN